MDGDSSGDDAHLGRVEAALATLSGVDIRAAVVIEHLRERGIGVDVLEQGETLADVVLAIAALHEDVRALRTLDELVQRACIESANRMGFDASGTAETAQRLRERLLLPGPRREASLATYDGRGPLLAWLRVSAARQALMLRRSEARHDAEELDPAAAVEPYFDPELSALKTDGAQAVKQAFHAAFDDLPARDKVLLAYHYLDRLTLRQIGRILGVDASTVQRRLRRVRGSLLAGTQRHFVASSDVAGAELDQVLGLVRSQLDLSVSRLLRAQREGEESR